MVPDFARAFYYRSRLYNRLLRRGAAKGVAAAGIVPVATWPGRGDPTRGAAIVDGRFLLAERERRLGPGPDAWDSPLTSRRATRELHGFAWLGDLAALGDAAARDAARGLVHGWLRRFDHWQPTAWAPDVTGNRVLAWLEHVAFLSDGAAPGFIDGMSESLAAQVRHLARSPMPRGCDAAPFDAAAAVAAGAVALPGFDGLLEPALARLAAALTRDVHTDGGHRARNPALQARVLARLVGVGRALEAGGRSRPDFLHHAIDRMTPALKALMHGDGGLALFNDATEGDPSLIADILSATGVRHRASDVLAQTGFQRLQAGPTTVILDAGANAADATGGHAGALAFEMSVRRHRMIVNCGAHPDETAEWADALKATAAHSTAVVDDTNAATIGGEAASGGIHVACRRNQRQGSTLVQMSHDGYRARFGATHNRDLYLAGTGDDFRGRDALIGGLGHGYALRFHLHPDVQALPAAGGDTVLLRLGNGMGWRFRASAGATDASITVEESVYMGQPRNPRRSRQIVVSGALTGGETVVKWSFLKEG